MEQRWDEGPRADAGAEMRRRGESIVRMDGSKDELESIFQVLYIK